MNALQSTSQMAFAPVPQAMGGGRWGWPNRVSLGVAELQKSPGQLAESVTVALAKKGLRGLPSWGAGSMGLALSEKGLAQGVKDSIAACAMELADWPLQRMRQRVFPTRTKAVAMALPDAQVWRKHVPCPGEWGSADIEAECWLEAGEGLNLPLQQLAMEFHVHQKNDASLWIDLMACDGAWVSQKKSWAWGAGLTLTWLEPESHALARALAQKQLPCFAHDGAAVCWQAPPSQAPGLDPQNPLHALWVAYGLALPPGQQRRGWWT